MHQIQIMQAEAEQKAFIVGAKHSSREVEEVLKEITRLQEKFDENVYDLPPLIKLKRIENSIDFAFEQYKKIIQTLK